MSRSLGIVGAGKLGTALAKAALIGGLDVWMTSRNVENTRLIAGVLAPGTHVGTLAEVVAHGEVILLAVPLLSLQTLPPHAFDGKVLVDAVNYWEPVDGPIGRYGVAMGATSSLVRDHFPGARLVKALNQLGYHDVEDCCRPRGALDRIGVAAAGDDAAAKAAVLELVDQMGFDPVDGGTLAEGERLGPGGPAFGAVLSAEELKRAIGTA